MVTRASTRKESTTKPAPKSDTPAPAEKSAPPKPPTDLISPKKKRPATEHKAAGEHRPVRRSGVPPISKARPHQQPPAPAQPAKETPPAPPPPKPQTVSLIEEKRPRKSEPASTGERETRSV